MTAEEYRNLPWIASFRLMESELYLNNQILQYKILLVGCWFFYAVFIPLVFRTITLAQASVITQSLFFSDPFTIDTSS